MKMSNLMPGMIIKSKFNLTLFFDKYGSYDFCERLPNNQKMIVLRRSQKLEGRSNKLSTKVYSFHNQKGRLIPLSFFRRFLFEEP